MNCLILTGPKHSGKTSAGKALALAASYDFIDLDELITQKTGKTPRQLYIEGTAVFQKAEAEAIAAIGGTDSKQQVIAAGGGIIDNPETLKKLKLLKADGTKVIYLKISAECAWQRITNSSGGELPPFLQTENPQETHRTLHERRAAAYLQLADIVIEAEDLSPEQTAAKVLDQILPIV